ncbi:hypothetical protein D3C80_1932240 [compost metagenome]
MRCRNVRCRIELVVLLARFNLLRTEAENEHVFEANALGHFYVGPIQGADGQCTI